MAADWNFRLPRTAARQLSVLLSHVCCRRANVKDRCITSSGQHQSASAAAAAADATDDAVAATAAAAACNPMHCDDQRTPIGSDCITVSGAEHLRPPAHCNFTR